MVQPRRRQDLCHPAGFSLRAFSSRSCRTYEGRYGAASPATQGDRGRAAMAGKAGIPGQQSGATPVAGATNVAPPSHGEKSGRCRAWSHPRLAGNLSRRPGSCAGGTASRWGVARVGSVSKVAITASIVLIYQVLFPSISIFETLPIFLCATPELCKGNVLPLDRGLLMSAFPLCQFILI